MSAQTDSAELVAVPLADLQALIAKAMTRWLSVADAAVYSSLSEESIRRLMAANKLTAHRPVRGKIVIDRLELDAFILGSTAEPRKGRGRGKRMMQGVD